jgi:hypothetical protein
MLKIKNDSPTNEEAGRGSSMWIFMISHCNVKIEKKEFILLSISPGISHRGRRHGIIKNKKQTRGSNRRTPPQCHRFMLPMRPNTRQNPTTHRRRSAKSHISVPMPMP